MNTYDMSRHPLTKLAEDAGFQSVAEFARACYLVPQCVFSNIRGVNKPGIERMFRYANVVGVPVESVIQIFYKDDWIYNHNEAELEKQYSCCN